MTLPPRSPAAPLLERVTLRFTVSVGLLGGLVALILLVALPLLGFEKGLYAVADLQLFSAGATVFRITRAQGASYPQTK